TPISKSSSVTITFPTYSNSGNWTVGSVFLMDSAGNSAVLDTAAVADLGYATTLRVISTADDVAPNLTSLSFSPASLDPTFTAANLAVNFTATDDKSGVKTVQLNLIGPSGGMQPVTVNLRPARNVVGSANFAFPRFSEAGLWVVGAAFLADAAGNTQI